jgi:hypothetical protein
LISIKDAGNVFTNIVRSLKEEPMDSLKRSVAALAEALAVETDSEKRRTLLQRLKRKLAQLSAIEDDAISPKEAYDGDYWRYRAERTRRLAARHRNEHVRLHFVKIADGYLELAKRADDVQRASCIVS